jgi:hypothetical protein
MKTIVSFFTILFAVVLSFYFAGMDNNVSADITVDCAEFSDPYEAGGSAPYLVDATTDGTFQFVWDVTQCTSQPVLLRLSEDADFQGQDLYYKAVSGGSEVVDFINQVDLQANQTMHIRLENNLGTALRQIEIDVRIE